METNAELFNRLNDNIIRFNQLGKVLKIANGAYEVNDLTLCVVALAEVCVISATLGELLGADSDMTADEVDAEFQRYVSIRDEQ